MTVPDLSRTPLAIQLLGPFEVRVNGAPLPRLRSRKGFWLLSLLTLRHGQAVERDWLAGLLWPESGPAQALHCLRVTLTDLRRALGAEACRLRSPTVHTLCFDLAGTEVDVVSFEAALRQGDPVSLERAVSLYRGPLLEGCAEEWAFQERQVREQGYLAALERLAALALAAGDVAAAEGYLRRAAAVDPLRESVQRALMEVLGAGGNYAAALLTYRELRLRLHRELNTEPDPETRALFERLRAEAREKAGVRGQGSGASKGSGDDAQVSSGWRSPARIAAGDGNGSNGHAPLTAQEPAPGEEVPRGEDGPGAESRRFRRADGEDSSPIGERRPEAMPEAGTLPQHLPLPLTRFFGREAEIARLCAALGCQPPAVSKRGPVLADSRQPTADGPRLITLTGPGGSGKTRLALQVGEALRAAYSEAVWFVPPLDLSEPHLIPDKLRQSLRLPPSSQRQPLEQVAAALSARPSLLILDNFEQLVEGGAELVETLLERVRTLAILVTSRQCLGVPGEREFPVAPLPVPGVQLFVDRAQAVRPEFVLTAENAVAVAGLCRRLEGIPLAIELAAARVRVLTPAQMLERLKQRFELLVGRQRGADLRHRSLRATLDWSYHLLSPELQRFFARLSVFRGGWRLKAAEAVCEAGVGRQALGVEEADSDPTPNARRPTPALEYLEDLQQCSLVETEAVGEEMRYRLLETLREYGVEQLTTEERSALAERHYAYYQDWFRNAKYLPGVGGVTIQQRMDEVEREMDNVRAALDWWVESGAAREWMVTAEAPPWNVITLVTVFWLVRGYAPEGRRRLREVLTLPGTAVPTRNRAHLLLRAGELALQQADFAAADPLLQESLAIYQCLSHWRYELLVCCRALALLARDQGDSARARSFHERHLAVAREIEVEWPIASALNEMGYTVYLEGDLRTGQSLLEESLQLLRHGQEIAWARAHPGEAAVNPDDYATGGNHLHTIASARAYLGEVLDTRGDHAAARDYLEASLAHFREFDRRSPAAYVLHRLGRVAAHQGHWTAAAAHFCESLAFWQQDGNCQGIAGCLEGLAAVAGGEGEAERAARLLGAAAALRERRGIPVPPVERADLERVIAAVRAALGEEAFTAAWAHGQALPLDQAIVEALEAAPAD